MGRIKNTSGVNEPSTMKHISHQHELELCNFENLPTGTRNSTVCSGCKVQPSGNMLYICKPCNFILHVACAKFPSRITHPSHPDHTLSLLATPFYSNGKFNCDACNIHGDGFSYHCKACDFDLHVVCASKPMEITHQLHKCKLGLMFENDLCKDSSGISCDVCSKMVSKQWFYSCGACRFDVHLDCATAKTRPGSTIQAQAKIQHQNTFPGANHHNQFQVPGSVQNLFPGVNLHNQFQAPGSVTPIHHMHSASMGSSSKYQNQIQAPIIANQGVNVMHCTGIGASPGYTNQFQVPINASQGMGTASPIFPNQFQAPVNANQGIGTLRPVHYMHSASMGATPQFQNQFQGPVMTNQLMHSASTGSMLNYQPPIATFQTLQNNQPSKTGGLMTGITNSVANQVGTSLVTGVISALIGL